MLHREKHSQPMTLEQVIAQVADGDSEDIDRAVSAARKAVDKGPWPKMTPYERGKILLQFADLVEKHNDELAALETWDNESLLNRRLVAKYRVWLVYSSVIMQGGRIRSTE